MKRNHLDLNQTPLPLEILDDIVNLPLRGLYPR